MFLAYWLLIFASMFTATVFSLMLEIRVIGGFWPSIKDAVKWSLILLITLLLFSFSSYELFEFFVPERSVWGAMIPYFLQAFVGTLLLGKFVYDDNMEAIGFLKGFVITLLFHAGAYGVTWLMVLGPAYTR